MGPLSLVDAASEGSHMTGNSSVQRVVPDQPQASSLHVPQDIINIIIDDIATSYHDFNTDKYHPLYTCALVSRAFHMRTTHHIFSRIEIIQPPAKILGDGEELMHRVKCLLEILTDNPAIGPSVRTLLVQAENGVHGTPRAWQIGRNFWTKKNRPLARVVLHMSCLQRFIFRGGFALRMWSDIHPATASALNAITELPSLLKLELHNVTEVPPSLLLHCRQLKEITLRDVEARSVPYITVSTNHANLLEGIPGPSLPFSLESANIAACSSAINVLLRLPGEECAFSGIRHLKVGIQTELDVWPSWCVILQAAKTLETLDLTWSDVAALAKVSPTPINLSPLSSLRHLNFTCGLDIWEAPEYIHQILDLKESSSNLETIHLRTGWGYIEGIVWAMGDGWWRRMDAVLCKEGYARLRKIVLVDNVRREEPEGSTRWLRGITSNVLEDGSVRDRFNFYLPGVLAMGRVLVDTVYQPLSRFDKIY